MSNTANTDTTYPRWLSRRQASTYLGIGLTTLDVLIARREIASFLCEGKRIIPVSAIVAYEGRKLAEAGHVGLN